MMKPDRSRDGTATSSGRGVAGRKPERFDRRRALACLAAAAVVPFVETRARAAGCPAILEHRIRPLMEPAPIDLCERFAGDVLLVVNTASRCGFTPQFDGLQALYERYRDEGFEVLGFPSDDFRQELDTEVAVANVCRVNYGVTFPMFEKISVQRDPHPLYRALGESAGRLPAWNFNKYLLDRDGNVVQHFGSLVEPMSGELTSAIERLI